MAKAAVQGSQVESGVSQAPAVALLAVALALGPGENQAVEVVQEAVRGAEDVLDAQVV